MRELLKYGGSGMVYLLGHLFEMVWLEMLCREGLIVKKVIRKIIVNFVGKAFHNILDW